MQPIKILGGWYISVLPDGPYAALVLVPGTDQADYLSTHVGRVDFFNNDRRYAPLFGRLGRRNGQLFFAGKCWHVDGYVEYDFQTKQWRFIDVAANSNFPVVYDQLGTLRINRGPGEQDLGANGIRYVERDGSPTGKLISGDDTYAPGLKAPGLSQWTLLPCGITIGQGQDVDGVLVYDGVKHRKLAAGVCKAVNAVEDESGLIGIGYYRELGGWNLESERFDHVTKDMLLALPETSAMPEVPVALTPNVSAFVFNGTWWADDSAPGNTAIGSPTYRTPRHQCVIEGEDKILLTPKERRLGLLVYCAGDDLAVIYALKRGRQFALDHDLVMFVFVDRRVYPLALVREYCEGMRYVHMPQWYVRAHGHHDEDAATFARNVIAQARQFNGEFLLPTVRATSPSIVPPTLVVEALNALITQGALKLPNYLGQLFFAWTRDDGPLKVPAIRPAIETWLNVPTSITDPQRWIAATFPNEVPVVKISDAIKNSILKYAARFAPPKTSLTGDAFEHWLDVNYRNPPDGWMHRCAQYLCFVHGPSIGHKRRSGSATDPHDGTPLSAGSFAIKEGNVMHVFDIMPTVGSGRLDVNVEAMTVNLTGDNAQVFFPVTPIDHLGSIPVSQRPRLPRAIGVDAFDLAPRIFGTGETGLVRDERRYFNEVVVPSKFATRNFTYANGRGGTRLWRDHNVGLQQTEQLMQLYVEKGIRGLWVVLCGTREDNWSEDQSLEFVARFNAVAVKYPKAVLGVAIFNERSHSIEQDYAISDDFCRRAEALIDMQFPCSWGANHGGEPVFTGGGSFSSHHSDRDLNPREAGALMGEVIKLGMDVADEEGMGIAEADRTAGRQRVSDPAWAQGQIDAFNEFNITVTILHIDVGMTCDMNEMGPVQRASIDIYAKANQKLLGTVPTPSTGTLGEQSRKSMIEIAYDTLLGRKPDPIGFQIYDDRLKSGWTVAQLEADIKASDEYKSKHPEGE